jgi:hypothetical protein
MHRCVPVNDGAPLAREIERQLDTLAWKVAYRDEQVAVAAARMPGVPVVAYRTVTEPEASVDAVVRFLGDGLLDAFAALNDRYAQGEILGENPRAVRTAFRLPWPLRDREFVHTVLEHRLSPSCVVIGYGAWHAEAQLPPLEGFLRCRMFPSGQRVTDLGAGRVRVEHLMCYPLGGWVTAPVQNLLFHAGHVSAYRKEWAALYTSLASGSTA